MHASKKEVPAVTSKINMAGGVGEYPAEYNAKIHGPYNPARYYGKPDISLGEVKLGELPSWLGRRNYHPLSIARAFGRGYHRWAQTWLLAKRPSYVPMGQVALGLIVFFYVTTMPFTKNHRHVKYH